ncbi:MAG TPA: response regulator transcription factor [Rectinemataceae bacterium]|nr:response regulator transcription factor [Rectinemataceae bacterium]
MKRVLVIDDEPQIRRLLRVSLEKRDFSVHDASTGFEGLQAIQSARPDIILLDLNLPDREGSGVLADIRSWSSIPVIIISVRNLENDIVTLLNSGADDYLIKPFSIDELVARMNAALRRTRPELRENIVKCGDLKVDFDTRLVSVENREIHLTPTEFAILSYLAKNCGKIVTQTQLLKELWGPLAAEEQGSLRVHISSLRKKIEDDTSRPKYLKTEIGIGYRLAP